MATIIDSLIVQLGLDPSGFNKGQKKASESLKNLEKTSTKTNKTLQESATKGAQSIAKFRNEVLGLTAAFLSVSAIKSFSDRITTADASLGFIAKNIGMTTEDLSAWSMAADKAGGSADGIISSFKGLTERIQQFSLTGEGAEGFKYFTSLGITLTDATGKMRSMQDIALDAADALHKMTPMKAVAWGKGMGFDEGTINVLMQGRNAVQALLDEQKKLAIVNAEDAQKAFERDVAWKKFSNTIENLGRKLLTDLSPIIIKLAEDFSAWAKKIDPDKIEDFFKKFIASGDKALDLVGGLTNAIELLFGLWAGSKFLGVLGAIGKMGSALGGITGLLGKIGLVGGVAVGGYKIGEKLNEMMSEKQKAYIDKGIDFVDEAATNIGGKLKGFADMAFGKLISRGEGGYSSVNLGKSGGYKAAERPLEQMTVNQVMEAQSKGEFNAAGRYQIIGSTLKDAVKELNLKGTEKFDKATQDLIFEKYLIENKRKAISDYISGKSNDLFAALKEASKEWASIADPETGLSHYAGIAGNKATVSVQEMTEKLQQARAQMTSNTNNVSSDVSVGTIVVNTQATDAPGIARDIGNALQSYQFANQANIGLM